MIQGGRAVALGFFDGLHLGHQKLLEETVRLAGEYSLTPAVLSFDVPPHALVSGQSCMLISGTEERRELLHRLFGIDEMLLLHFDETLRRMSWEDFTELLRREYGASALVAGYDFRFGYRGEGTAEKLMEKCRACSIPCRIVEKVTLDGTVVSSTHIRALLSQGNVEEAERFLGHPYFLRGRVTHGYAIGRTLGFPTANLTRESGVLLPKRGVYATLAHLENGQTVSAVTNIGRRPTFDGEQDTIESHLLDFSGDLYGQTLRLELKAFLRPERPFPDVESLKQQIEEDRAGARLLLQDRKA